MSWTAVRVYYDINFLVTEYGNVIDLVSFFSDNSPVDFSDGKHCKGSFTLSFYQTFYFQEL